MAVTVDDIKDWESLRDWLKDRPSEDSRLIVFRSALRALPFLSRAAFEKDFANANLLPTFRAHTVARVAGTWSTSAAKILAAARALEHPGGTAYSARVAAAAAIAADASAADANGAAAYAAVREDAHRLADGMVHVSLAMQPLWPGNGQPDWFD